MNEQEYPKLKNRFERRYNNDNREWIDDTSIDEILEEIKQIQLFYYDGWCLTDDWYVTWCFYCCGSAPLSKVVFEFHQFTDILDKCRAGDIIQIWILSEEEPKYYRINCPDVDGLFPKNGAY